MIKRNILCIDLKSFFASVECVERNYDPYTTPLVVCDLNQKGAITLAVTPYLKKLGINGRTRIYDIPKDLKIIKVPPRMKLYQQKSKEVLSIFLDFIAEDDIYVYSIDEAFLDVTNYLKLYKMSDYELALTILKTIFNKTKLTATAGIGPNMLIAKVAMDTEAKHTKNNIARWSYDDIENKLWKISPLSKMWGIGPKMEKKLNEINLYTVGDIAKYDKNKLRQKFGIMGEELWLHANGIDNTQISDLKRQITKDKSISHSQVLFKDYFSFNIPIIIYEMVEVLCKRLRCENMLCAKVGFGISYSKKVGGGFYHSKKLDALTNKVNIIYKICLFILDQYYQNLPIRKVSISLGRLSDNNLIQLNLFESIEETAINDKLNSTIDEINTRFGKNALLKGSSLLKDSTIIERNNKIGGHHV